METVLRDTGRPHRILPWEPWGGDERQFCSPGFDLPVGTLMRTPHGEFDGYHTSADSLDRIRPESLADAVETCLALVEVLETNRRCVNLSPYGEPQLGRRGLYRSAGGAVPTPDDERALLWVLNRSDGGASLLEIARGSGLPYADRPARRRAARAGRPAGRDRRVRAAAVIRPSSTCDRRSPSGARTLEGRTCVVTGASSGIGRAIALALGSAGATVCAVARRGEELEATARRAPAPGVSSSSRPTSSPTSRSRGWRRRWRRATAASTSSCTAPGRSRSASLETAPVEDLDRQYAANVRAPYLLTQALLPVAARAPGPSRLHQFDARASHARANLAQYAATKHALKAIADSLREEINPRRGPGGERLPRPHRDAAPGQDPRGRGKALPPRAPDAAGGRRRRSS